MKKTAHIISHTHWDREWYMPFERHHVRLVKLMDSLLDTLDKDPEYKSFHLDGQTIVVDDYLQVRPEMKEKIMQYVQEGRLHMGPWYVLQDEFLTSSEANLRNLQIGHRETKPYGPVSKIGYFPDSFGNMGQAPQILQQAGIDTAVFGRGVKPVGVNNAVQELETYESPYSEMIWNSPDGSSVLGILFANWYHNGMEIPVDEKEALNYWKGRLANVERFASTPHLLFMNGCDHQPVQTDLSSALRTANTILPDYTFIHSNFDDYIKSVKSALSGVQLTEVAGELRSQRTDGWWTLVNTASSRIYLKQMNQRCQTLLERAAEPLAAMAQLVGGTKYPHALLVYAWKTLMQNHPHDSICGCSVDEVHREMVTRFEKARQVAETIVEDSLEAIVSNVDTSRFKQEAENATPFAVFNTTGWNRSFVHTFELEIKRVYFDEGKSREQVDTLLNKETTAEGYIVDSSGNPVVCTVEDLGVHFRYELPENRFRRPYMARCIRVTFEAVGIPALGYNVYAWVPQTDSGTKIVETAANLANEERTAENEFLKLQIAEDGTYSILDKRTGHVFEGLGVYENVGDIGNEYVFKQPDGERPITTKGLKASINLVENTPYRAIFEVVHDWRIPTGADDLLLQETAACVSVPDRKAQRVSDTVPLVLRTRISLEKHGRGVKVSTSFRNEAKNHRLRVLFPTDLPASKHEVDSIFEVALRDIDPAKEWKNPSNCQHQQAFVDVSGEKAGLTVANLGLPEYEVLRDGRNTMAITLLRSIGELGDWGVFPTPEAQCIGDQFVEFMIIPHAGGDARYGAYNEAYQLQAPVLYRQTQLHEGSLPSNGYGLVKWNGPSLALSGVKLSDEAGHLMLRWFNMANQEEQLTIRPQFELSTAYVSNVLEEQTEEVIPYDGEMIVPVTVRGAEIITLGLKL